MAGARPEYFPVILAMAATGVSARGSTTSSMAAMAVVNGPIRHELDMNAGIGALGPYNHANATIGRACGLLSQNLQGGSVPGITYMGSQGNNYAYNNITFPENEERSPWEPFHVEHGFSPTTARSASSAAAARPRSPSACARSTGASTSATCCAAWTRTSRRCSCSTRSRRGSSSTGAASTKEKLIHWVYENALMPAGEFWDYQLVQNYIYPRATFGEEPLASKLRAAPDELIQMFEPEDIHVVVVGGETNAYWRIMGATYAKTVSVDDWR